MRRKYSSQRERVAKAYKKAQTSFPEVQKGLEWPRVTSQPTSSTPEVDVDCPRCGGATEITVTKYGRCHYCQGCGIYCE